MLEITTVLFDLGGVVCRYDPAPRHAALAMDSGLSIAEVRTRLDALDNAAFDRGEYTSEQWRELLVQTLGTGMNLQELRRTQAIAFVPDEDVLRVVDGVREHACTALFTNNPSLLHEVFPIAFPQLTARFDPMVFTYMLGHTKPAVEAFAGALKSLDEPAERIVFVDDSAANVEAGMRAGMQAILYESPGKLIADLERMTGWSLSPTEAGPLVSSHSDGEA